MGTGLGTRAPQRKGGDAAGARAWSLGKETGASRVEIPPFHPRSACLGGDVGKVYIKSIPIL
jgi:hypothetical protein